VSGLKTDIGEEPRRYPLERPRRVWSSAGDWLSARLSLRRRSERDPRTILGPAIRFSELGVVALPAPAEHDDVMALVQEQFGSRRGKHRGEIGFVTAGGRFVLPREALILARLTHQVPTRGSADAELKCSDLR
jgi:hypothetical protein